MSSELLMRTHRRVRPRRRKMTQTKFLITGATGYTGGYTVRQLLEKNQAVRVLAHRSDDRSKQLQKVGAEVVIGDFLDFVALRPALIGFHSDSFLSQTATGYNKPSTRLTHTTSHTPSKPL